jgi:hypothetical protein
MPFRLLPFLREAFDGIEFREFDPTENFPDSGVLYFIDTVIGIDKVVVLRNIDQLEDSPHVSVHDADLGFHLKWLRKLGKNPKVVIFGVPAEGDERVIAKELAADIRSNQPVS